jgi:hypothetical protein
MRLQDSSRSRSAIQIADVPPLPHQDKEFSNTYRIMTCKKITRTIAAKQNYKDDLFEVIVDINRAFILHCLLQYRIVNATSRMRRNLILDEP